MKLEIKLKDPKYCDGCPCLYVYQEPRESEPSEWGIILHSVWYFTKCGVLNKIIKKGTGRKILRPQKCIEENGE